MFDYKVRVSSQLILSSAAVVGNTLVTRPHLCIGLQERFNYDSCFISMTYQQEDPFRIFDDKLWHTFSHFALLENIGLLAKGLLYTEVRILKSVDIAGSQSFHFGCVIIFKPSH
jgi:hypothetical protein